MQLIRFIPIARLFLLVLLVSLVALAAPATPVAHAATITVSNLNDSGAGSLRQAITDAMATGAADTINFNVSGTITLGSTLPNITAAGGALTIDGTGRSVTISGNNATTIFTVDAGATVNLQNITVANGKNTAFPAEGGAFKNSGSLNITNSTFSSNGTSSSQSRGGAIFSAAGATLSISSSTFSSNNVSSAWCEGGAIYIQGGIAAIVNSTFSGNSATCQSNPNGGGIFVNSGTVSITHSTFSNNSASGNASAEGGAIYVAEANITLRNTIIANNSPTGKNCRGVITDGGNNLRWPSSDTTCVGAYLNPLLAALANNGGSTQTMALQAGSAAIDRIASAGGCGVGVTTDQRGVARPRPTGGLCDIGAYEYDPPVPTPTPAPREVPEADTLLLTGGGVGGLATWFCWQWSKRRAR